MPDYYLQLGLVPGATDAQVQRAVRRYWQRVARFRPVRENQPFLAAATVLSNPHLRAMYDPAYRPGPAPAQLAANYLRRLSGHLRTELHREQARGYRLEQEVRSQRAALAHALEYPQAMAEMRTTRRQLWSRLALLLLLPVAYGLLRALGSSGGVASLAGPPYQPVAEGTNWLMVSYDTAKVYEQAELMPQYPGGAVELRGLLRQRVYGGAAGPRAARLCATGQVRFVVDSAGYVRGPAQVLGVPAPDSAGRQLLRQAASGLPRLVPGYVRARPVAVRLTVPLAD